MQNSSPNQMMMLTTRIGINSKMVITGDVKQSDKSAQNGLTDLINKLHIYYNFNNSNSNFTDNKANIRLVELQVEDVERSDIVKKIISIYNYSENPTYSSISSSGSGSGSSSGIGNRYKIQKENENEKNYNYGSRIYTNNYFINENDAALIPKSHTFRKIWE
jgi:hypothetical protein